MTSVTSAPLAGSTVVVVTVSRSRLVDPVMEVAVLDDVTGRLVTVVFTVGALIVVVAGGAAVDDDFVPTADSVTPKMSLNEGLVGSASVSAASDSREDMSLSWHASLLLRHTFGSLSERLERKEARWIVAECWEHFMSSRKSLD